MLTPAKPLCLLALLAMAGCAYPDTETMLATPPQVDVRTPTQDALQALPPPARQLVVAVYGFQDLTGQNKPNEDFPEYSRAVTQGGAAVLVNALKKAGTNAWFKVVERGSLQPLLQERNIIRQTRETYGGQNLPPLPPLTYAGLLLDGGIVGYDSNTVTGGFGARFLGIGGDVQYRRDSVTVYLRAVAVQTGEVIKSVSTTKTIYSVGGRGGAFRYVDFKDLLEVETGFTHNEPVLLAVRQAVEKAVFALVVEGLADEFWSFREEGLEGEYIRRYLEERDGTFGVQRATIPAAEALGGTDAKPPVPITGNGSGLQVAPPPRREPEPGAPSLEADPSAVPPPRQETGPTYVLPTPERRSPIPDARVRDYLSNPLQQNPPAKR